MEPELCPKCGAGVSDCATLGCHPGLDGVYVQAWVWVVLDPDAPRPTDEAVRQHARECWQADGIVEIDDEATVSWPEEG